MDTKIPITFATKYTINIPDLISEISKFIWTGFENWRDALGKRLNFSIFPRIECDFHAREFNDFCQNLCNALNKKKKKKKTKWNPNLNGAYQIYCT